MLLPTVHQLRDARAEGFWLASVVWLPLGALAGWLACSALSGVCP
jgi:hypothetical protein